jgi:hypothetical protein
LWNQQNNSGKKVLAKGILKHAPRTLCQAINITALSGNSIPLGFSPIGLTHPWYGLTEAILRINTIKVKSNLWVSDRSLARASKVLVEIRSNAAGFRPFLSPFLTKKLL